MLTISNLPPMEVYISTDVPRFPDGILCVIVDYFRLILADQKFHFIEFKKKFDNMYCSQLLNLCNNYWLYVHDVYLYLD